VLEWEERVAREVERQARIEAAFDRADALSGGLSPSQLAQRSRLANAAHRARRRLAISRPAPTIRVRERETDH
jgi:hypothetical protein